MPAILDKIKSSVRGRSRSRGSRDETNYNQRSSEEVPKTPTVPSQFQDYPRASLENSAFHVTSGRGVRQSLDNSPVQQREPENNYSPDYTHRKDVGSSRKDIRAADAIPDRTSSRAISQDTPLPHHPSQIGIAVNGSASPPNTNLGSDGRSVGGVSAQRQSGFTTSRKSYPLQDGADSRPRKSYEDPLTPSRRTNVASSTPLVSDNVVPPAEGALNQVPHEATSSPIRRLSSSEGGTRRKPVPLSQNKGSQHTRAASNHLENEKLKRDMMAAGHLKLPAGFDLDNTEQTHVNEYQRPAVTHETIIKQRTEIVQEAISRDIHYHHYYTYMQPIKVVEILPPKHYFLDHKTGVKTEIIPPAGWTMPTSTNPISPDYNGVSGWTRHYVVNEQHPNGLLESPPLKHEGDVDDLRRVAQKQAY